MTSTINKYILQQTHVYLFACASSSGSAYPRWAETDEFLDTLMLLAMGMFSFELTSLDIPSALFPWPVQRVGLSKPQRFEVSIRPHIIWMQTHFKILTYFKALLKKKQRNWLVYKMKPILKKNHHLFVTRISAGKIHTSMCTLSTSGWWIKRSAMA